MNAKVSGVSGSARRRSESVRRPLRASRCRASCTAKSEEPYARTPTRAPDPSTTGRGTWRARRLELAGEAVHVGLVVLGPLGVGRALGVAGAAREERRGHVVDLAGEGAVRDAVAVHVAVAGELLELRDVRLELFLGPDDLAPVDRLLGIRERVGHPVVHAEVEVRHDEHGRLESLRQVESLDRELVALLHRARDEQDVLRVAVGEEVRREDVALHRPRRQAGRGAHALDVHDDGRDLGVVAETDELRHERDAGARSRRHRARARPARAEHHADRGELVLRLHDGAGGLAGDRVAPVFLRSSR